MNIKIRVLIILCLLNIALIILNNRNNLIEFFQTNPYDFVKHCENTTKLSSNKLISRIRKVDKNIYKRSGLTNDKTQHILVQDFKHFIDNELSNLKEPKIVNIVDHPFKSTCESTFNYKNFLDNEYIEKVYCENWNDQSHSKVIITPIGIESKMCNIVNNDELKLINFSKNQKNIKDKPLKILSNAHLNTHPSPSSGSYDQRTEMYNELKNNPLIDFWKDKVDRTETWKQHDNYSFELCPEGNGLDTHRFYEALYLNTIPIVKKNSLESLYRKYPCVIVNDWNEITEENCRKWKKELQDRVEKEKYKLNTDYGLINTVENFINPIRNIVLIHVGKCGGANITYKFKEIHNINISQIHVWNTDKNQRKQIIKNNDLCLLLRNPIDRYISIFNYWYEFNLKYINNEIVPHIEQVKKYSPYFEIFKTADSLAVLLSSENKELKQKAYNFMKIMQHIKEGLCWYLCDEETIVSNKENFKFVIRQEHYKEDFKKYYDYLCYKYNIKNSNYNYFIENPSNKTKTDKYISPKGIVNLKKYFKKDYDFLQILIRENIINKEDIIDYD